MSPRNYGTGDSSYRAAGELAGITQLVDDFYQMMDTLPDAQKIRAMHPPELDESRQKLAYFLSGWLGGPRLYQQHYGGISIPKFHQLFNITDKEREAWLLCMANAIECQPYDGAFKHYLLAQLAVPAKRIQNAVEQRKQR